MRRVARLVRYRAYVGNLYYESMSLMAMVQTVDLTKPESPVIDVRECDFAKYNARIWFIKHCSFALLTGKGVMIVADEHKDKLT